MRRAASLALLAFASAVRSQTADIEHARVAIRDCALELEGASGETTGLDALEAACPGVRRALEDAGYLPLLTPAQQQTLSGSELQELELLHARYREPGTHVTADPAGLPAILGSLREPPGERPLTRFERLKRWLRELFERQQIDSDSWLERWLQGVSVPGALSNALIYGSILLIIVLAVAVIINELRVAGLLRPRRAAPAAAGGSLAATASGAADPMTPTSARARITLLLQALVATLVSGGRLQVERSLTHRELGLRAVFDDDEQRRCFQRVAALAERTTYGAGEVPPEELEPAVAAGQSLQARLRGSAA